MEVEESPERLLYIYIFSGSNCNILWSSNMSHENVPVLLQNTLYSVLKELKEHRKNREELSDFINSAKSTIELVQKDVLKNGSYVYQTEESYVHIQNKYKQLRNRLHRLEDLLTHPECSETSRSVECENVHESVECENVTESVECENLPVLIDNTLNEVLKELKEGNKNQEGLSDFINSVTSVIDHAKGHKSFAKMQKKNNNYKRLRNRLNRLEDLLKVPKENKGSPSHPTDEGFTEHSDCVTSDSANPSSSTQKKVPSTKIPDFISKYPPPSTSTNSAVTTVVGSSVSSHGNIVSTADCTTIENTNSSEGHQNIESEYNIDIVTSLNPMENMNSIDTTNGNGSENANHSGHVHAESRNSTGNFDTKGVSGRGNTNTTEKVKVVYQNSTENQNRSNTDTTSVSDSENHQNMESSDCRDGSKHPSSTAGTVRTDSRRGHNITNNTDSSEYTDSSEDSSEYTDSGECIDSKKHRASRDAAIPISCSYEFVMSREDWVNMGLSEELIDPKTAKSVNAKFQGRDRGNIISCYIKNHDTAKTNVDIEKTHVNLLNSQKKNSPRIRMEMYCVFRNTENCQSYYIATVSRQENLNVGPVMWKILKHGVCDHTAAITASRPLCGKQRDDEKAKLQNKNPSKHHNEKLLQFGEQAIETGDSTAIKNPAVFAQCKSESRQEQRLATHWYDDVRLRKNELEEKYQNESKSDLKIKGAFHDIMEEPAMVLITSQEQIKMMKESPIFYLDMTGQLCCDIDGKKVLLTTLLSVVETKDGGKIEIPAIQMFSNKNDSESVTRLMLKVSGFFNCVHPLLTLDPELIVTDGAWENIYGILNVYAHGRISDQNKCNLEQYLNLCHRIVNGNGTDHEIKTFFQLQICYAHEKKNVCDALGRLILANVYTEEVKSLYMHVFYILQNVTTYAEFKSCFRRFSIVALSEFVNDTVTEALVFLHDRKYRETIDDEACSCLDGVEEDVTNCRYNLKTSSPFHIDCVRLRDEALCDIDKELGESHESEVNKFHLPDFFEYIMENKAFNLSMWTGIMFQTRIRYARDNEANIHTPCRTRICNAHSESYNSSYKRQEKGQGHLPNLAEACIKMARNNEARVIKVKFSMKYKKKTRKRLESAIHKVKNNVKSGTNRRKRKLKENGGTSLKKKYNEVPLAGDTQAKWGKAPKKQVRKKFDRESKSSGISELTKNTSSDCDCAVPPKKARPEAPRSSINNMNVETECRSENKGTSPGNHMNAEIRNEGTSAFDSGSNNVSESPSAPATNDTGSSNSGSSARNIFYIGPYRFDMIHDLQCISIDHNEFGSDEAGNLGDGSIDPFIHLLCEHANRSRVEHNSVIAMPINLSVELFTGKEDGFKDGLIQYCRDSNFTEKDILVFPILTGARDMKRKSLKTSLGHYKILIVNTVAKEILAIDSFGGYFRNKNEDTDAVKAIRFYYFMRGRTVKPEVWKAVSPTKRYQSDTRSCGVYLCFWIYILCSGDIHYANMEFQDGYMSEFRDYMKWIFECQYEKSLHQQQDTPVDVLNYMHARTVNYPEADNFTIEYRSFTEKSSDTEIRKRLLSYVMRNNSNQITPFMSGESESD